MMRLALFVLILTLYYSCNKKNENFSILNGSFPEHLNISFEQLDDIGFPCPDDLVFMNGFLLIINNCTEKLLQLVRVEDLQTTFFLDKGHGPNEFLRVRYSGHKMGDSILLRNTPDASIWLNPYQLHDDAEYSLRKFFDPVPINQNENVFHFSDKWVYNDYSDFSSHKGFFVILDQNRSLVNKTDFLPPLSYSVSETNLGYVYLANTSYNEAQNKFVSALKYFPYVFIIDAEGRYEKIIQTESSYVEPIFGYDEINPKLDTEFFYPKVILSDEYIFVYRLNMTLGELVSIFTVASDKRKEIETRFEVYTWSGTCISNLF